MNDVGKKLDRIDAQISGIVGVVAALVAAASEASRDRASTSLEALHAVLLADPGKHSEEAIDGLRTPQAALLPQQDSEDL